MYFSIPQHALDEHELRFECTQCGDCCKRPGALYLSSEEAASIAAYLGVSLAYFYDEYLEGNPPHIYNAPGHACSFLAEDNSCSIYPVRPTQCKTYPFWPHILENQETWEAERRVCEGIGRGSIVEENRVQESLCAARKGFPGPPTRG